MASSGSQPNLRDSGHSAPSPSQRMRQNTCAPGAARAIFSTSSLAVDREEADAARESRGDVALFLDRVAVGDAVGRGAGGERHVDLGDRGAVEGRAELGEELQDLRRRVGLDRVEDAAVRQRAGEGGVVLAHDIEVDHEAGAVGSSVAEEVADTVGHSRELPSQSHVETAGPLIIGQPLWRRPIRDDRGPVCRLIASWVSGWQSIRRTGPSACRCLRLDREFPFRTAGKM